MGSNIRIVFDYIIKLLYFIFVNTNKETNYKQYDKLYKDTNTLFFIQQMCMKMWLPINDC